MIRSIPFKIILLLTNLYIRFSSVNLVRVNDFMNKRGFLVLLIYLPPFLASGQGTNKLNIGLGVGLDYGGFGSRVTYNVSPRIGAFGCLGYNLDALGYNIGVQFREPISERFTLFVNGMYGYNAVLIVDSPQGKVKTTYFGPSLAFGVQQKSKRNENFWSSELIIPFRDKSLFNAMDDLRLAGYSFNYLFPVLFSIGYHIKLQ